MLYCGKWLIGISCPGVRTLNIHQKLLNSVCRHVSTPGDFPSLLSYSFKETLASTKCFGLSARHDVVHACEQLNKVCLVHI